MNKTLIFSLLFVSCFLMSCELKKIESRNKLKTDQVEKYIPGFILASAEEDNTTGLIRLKLYRKYFSTLEDHRAPSIIYKYSGKTFDTYENVWFKIKKVGNLVYASDIKIDKPCNELIDSVDLIQNFINEGHAINIHNMNFNHGERQIHRAGHFPNFERDLQNLNNRDTLYRNKLYFETEFLETNGNRDTFWIPIPMDTLASLYLLSNYWTGPKGRYKIGTYLTPCDWHVGTQDPFCSF